MSAISSHSYKPRPTSGSARQNASLPTAWTPPEGLDRPGWILHGRRLGALSRKSNWWVGDWLRFGAAKWGEKYVLAAKITGHDTHSLENMVYVASHVDISLRRENLSWSHHCLVAAFDPEEQTYWLDRATECKFSVNDLRIELRAAKRALKGGSGGSVEDGEQTPAVVCPKCGFRLTDDGSESA
jgi:hypothetical protein